MFSTFELDREKKKLGPNWVVLGVTLVVVLAAAGVVFYLVSKPAGKGSAPAAASVAQSKADPVHDLRFVRATMGKDPTGNSAVWSVVLKNSSFAYTYSAIRYETSYLGADSAPILVNQGTISTTLDPGEEKSSEFLDALYPSGTARYKIRVTGATSAAN